MKSDTKRLGIENKFFSLVKIFERRVSQFEQSL